MPYSKPQQQQLAEPRSELSRMAEQTQAEFEFAFFSGILKRHPNYVEVLRVQAKNLAALNRHEEGLELDRRLTRLRPMDPLTHYNYACSCALNGHIEDALQALSKALEYGYRDVEFILTDPDLDSLHNDPRFFELLGPYFDDSPSEE
jgi:tetratricopeptide (TPR) repeat protein